MKRRLITASLSFILITAISLSCLNSGTALGENDRITVPSDMTLTSQETFSLGNGVTEFHIETNDSKGKTPVKSYIAQVDLTKNVTILANYGKYYKSSDPDKWTVSSWSLSKTSSQAKRYEEATGGKVLVATNGDFYTWGTGKPKGALVINGTTYHSASDRPYFAILDNGTAVIRDAGSKITDDVSQAVGGSYMPVKDGQITPTALGANVTLEPCNAIGIRGDGSVIILMVDGRDDGVSEGYTLYDQARMLISLGCVNALCLDCGGSCTFVSRHKNSDSLELQNNPSDGKERSISSTLMIVATEKSLVTVTPTPVPTKKPSATNSPAATKKPSATKKPTATKKPATKTETGSDKNNNIKDDTKKNDTDSFQTSAANSDDTISQAIFSSVKKFKKGKNLYRIISKENKTAAFCGTVRSTPKKVIIPAAVKYQGTKYKITTIDKKACMDNQKLKKIKIGKNIVKIKNKAFYNCTSLKKIIGLQYIGNVTFEYFYNKYVLKEDVPIETTPSESSDTSDT